MEQRTVVVKVGSNVLTDHTGSLDLQAMSRIVMQLVHLRSAEIRVILVSSGAVASGLSVMPMPAFQDRVRKRQLLAAVGQPHLIQTYVRLFAEHDVRTGQILATKEDFRDRRHYLNMRNCLSVLLGQGVIPIVNENDVIAVEELMFTDNDELAGLVASMLNASDLIILTSVDGIYDGHPDNPGSTLIDHVGLAQDLNDLSWTAKKSSFGRGGMHTKYRVAKKLAKLGTRVYIAHGKKHDLAQILAGDATCTYFESAPRTSNVKKWLAYQDNGQQAVIKINAGAVAALTGSAARSLLPVGIVAIEGTFKKGDVLRITAEDGQQVGLGIAQYGHSAAKRHLGLKGKKALVHYDYLILV